MDLHYPHKHQWSVPVERRVEGRDEKTVWVRHVGHVEILRRMWGQILHQTRVSVQEGFLVVGRHNKVNAETGMIAIQALGSNRVRDKPKIITCRDTPDPRAPASECNHLSSTTSPLPPTPLSSSVEPQDTYGHFFDCGDLLILTIYHYISMI